MRGWDLRNAYYARLLESLASHYGFDIETPFAELPETLRRIVLEGSGEEAIEFSYLDERGRSGGAVIRSKASFRTWNAATARPTRRSCATNSPST